MQPTDSGLLTAAEVAVRLRVTPWFVTERCRSGEIRASKPGKSWLIAPADVEAYLDQHSNRPVGADESGAA
jgi:excisionase family DNA binding protein